MLERMQRDNPAIADSRSFGRTAGRIAPPHLVDGRGWGEMTRPNARMAADGEHSEQTVLIVDDDPDVGDLLSEYLEFCGARAIVARSAEQARALLDAGTPVAAVVTDYAMPGEDGLALLAQLRATPSSSTLPVVMISGHDTHGEIAAAARALGAEFLGKPVDLVALVALLRCATERS
jgi:DNA-binding NtrC family response regulator